MQTLPLQGSHLEAHATPLTRMASVAGITVGSSVSAAHAVVPNLNPNVLPFLTPARTGWRQGQGEGLWGFNIQFL